MSVRVIGQRQFTDGATRPVYADEQGQYVVDDGERIDGVWRVPEGDEADLPVIVRRDNADSHNREAP
jgi:hypothetical protein